MIVYAVMLVITKYYRAKSSKIHQCPTSFEIAGATMACDQPYEYKFHTQAERH
jgi:hypothetical protein